MCVKVYSLCYLDSIYREKDRYSADPKYLSQSIEHMRIWQRIEFGKEKKLLFLGVGDNYMWNKENFPVSDDIEVLQIKHAETAMSILSQCNHSIMTVGTFGWWGSFLAGGKVIYMKNVTIPGTKFARFFVPENHFLPNWFPL